MKELYEWLLEWWAFSRGWLMFTDYERECGYYKQSNVVVDYNQSFNERCMNSIEMIHQYYGSVTCCYNKRQGRASSKTESIR
jgi:hypothetical protein